MVMTLTAERLAQHLAQRLDDRLHELGADAPPARYVVAFSGGLDSTVLLHALTRIGGQTPVLAVHVDHGLHPESGAWSEHCRRFAEQLGITFRAERIRVENLGEGIEAAARRARYARFEALLEAGDWLLSAHHEEDQAETLLLNLLRGSGPLGLAGIAETRPLGAGVLVRPLLDASRQVLEAYAQREELSWQDDPSNRDPRFDRNFLRAEILPLLRERWPASPKRLARSATLAAEASTLLDGLASLDLERAGRAERLAVDVLFELSAPRQRNLLKYAIRTVGLPPAPATRLERISGELLDAREDAEPLVQWPGGEARRYRGHVYLLPAWAAVPSVAATLAPGRPVDLGAGVGQLRLEASAGSGIDPGLAEAGLAVGFRAGGERLRIAADRPRRKLKALLQETDIVPWMRGRIPLLTADDRLIAVADLWTDADSTADGGYVVRWDDHPPLH